MVQLDQTDLLGLIHPLVPCYRLGQTDQLVLIPPSVLYFQ